MNTTVSLALGKHSTFLLLSSLHRPHPRSDTQGSAHRVVLDIVPNALAADDAPAQDVVALAVDDRSYHHSARQKFNELPVRKVPLSRYRDIFDRKLPSKAIDLMRHRTEIFIGPELSYDALHPNLAWDLNNHFIDSLVVFSAAVGFDSVLPATDNDLLFSFSLDLHQPGRNIKLKHTPLLFPVERSVLYLGKTRGKDDLWLFMVPNEYFDDDSDLADQTPATVSSVDKLTSMTGPHYWMIVMYFAYVFEKVLTNGSVFCVDKYPDIFNSPLTKVRACTNILYALFSSPFSCLR
jgi:hypothetical protein